MAVTGAGMTMAARGAVGTAAAVGMTNVDEAGAIRVGVGAVVGAEAGSGVPAAAYCRITAAPPRLSNVSCGWRLIEGQA
ncbi:hypothetical protein HK28_09660 [Acetobacter sp. DsW_063]|nr:hypothetical protein HK28_09660 [Acetobacter sp. DsW_063]